MISEPVRPVEGGAFQVPAIVFLAPKRRSRPNSATTLENKEADELTVLNASPIRRGYRLKRSGRLMLRWIGPKLPAPMGQVEPNEP